MATVVAAVGLLVNLACVPIPLVLKMLLAAHFPSLAWLLTQAERCESLR